MKIVTFNAWHGLNGKGVLRLGELEEPLRRARRLQRQVQMLRELGPDIAFLQEVNPLALRLPALERELTMCGVGQNDLCGVKIMGRGLPANLSSGMAILARQDLRKRSGLRLSGSKLSFASTYFSFQVAETRYALLAEANTREFGKLLLVNAHLHHGPEPVPVLLEQLRRLAEERLISDRQYDKVVRELEHARDRRLGEGRRMMDEVATIGRAYDGVIIAGDLNADPESAVVDLIKRSGFFAVVPDTLRTWDKARNSYNFALSEAFSLPISDFGIPALRAALRDYDHRLTSLDHIFVSRDLCDRVRSVALFGDDLPPDEMTSDHFGVVAELR